MKRRFILLFFVLISSLNASFLIDVYNKDYGVIDRTVLVFDTKPQYDIIKHESGIQISLRGCSKDASLQKYNIANSKVLTGFDYLLSSDGIMVIININTSQLLVTGEAYRVDGMEIQGDVFKLVLDIFISTNPQSLSELTSYSSFYEATGNDKLATEYVNKVVKLHNKIKAQREYLAAQKVSAKKPMDIISDLKTSTEVRIKKFNIKIISFVFGVIVLIILIIYIVIKLFRRNTSDNNVDMKSLRPIDGFADSTYLKKLAQKLSSKNWEFEEIAEELELPIEEVQKFIAPDLQQELEHL